jgi:hypothetical protein
MHKCHFWYAELVIHANTMYLIYIGVFVLIYIWDTKLQTGGVVRVVKQVGL